MPIPADYTELPAAGIDARRIEASWAFSASSAGEHIVLPDGRMDLIVRFRVDTSGSVTSMKPAIIGPSQAPARVPVEAGDRFFGLRYRPGWGGACLGLPPSTLRDSGLYGEAAATVLGGDMDLLRAATTPDLLRSALLDAGRRRTSKPSWHVPASTTRAIDLLHLAGGRLALPEAARAVDVPERTLRRHVGEAVGLSFKALAAVLRFQRTMRLLAASPGLTLASAALEGGYSDQAHMTREFRRYGGFTPGHRPPVAFGSLPIGGMAETFKREVGAPA
jgi:AraC-like DNA-binding protein